MNHAYREKTPDPHIHWWVIPRYDQPVKINDWTFEDPLFGDPYDHSRWLAVPKEIHQEITRRIMKAITSPME